MSVGHASWVCKELFSGGLAGALSVFIGNPFDVVKVRQQTMPEVYRFIIPSFRTIIKYEGISGLYKGLSSPFFAQFLMNSVSFGVNSMAMQFFEPDLKRGQAGSDLNVLLSGSLGGLVHCIILSPTDLVKCRMQMEEVSFGSQSKAVSKYRGSIDCVLQVFREEGVRGLYRGFCTTCIREVPSFGFYFWVYNRSIDLFTNPGEAPSTPVILLSGGLAGSLSWTSVYPIDVIKTHIQLSTPTSSAALSKTGSPTFLQMTRSLHAKYGISVFFKGIQTTIIRAFPVNAAVFYFYDVFRDSLGILPAH